MNYKLKLGAVVGLMALAASANAATVWNNGSRTPDLVVNYARVNSATTPALLGKLEVDPKKTVTVWLKASTNVTATVATVLSNSTVLSSEDINVGTTHVSRTFPAPAYFQGLLVSIPTPASLTSVHTLSATVIQTK